MNRLIGAGCWTEEIAITEYFARSIPGLLILTLFQSHSLKPRQEVFHEADHLAIVLAGSFHYAGYELARRQALGRSFCACHVSVDALDCRGGWTLSPIRA
jgi:hypothetical protein